MKKNSFISRFGWLISFVLTIASALFLFGTVFTYETKFYIGEEKVKEYFDVNLLKLFDTSLTSKWPAILLLVLIGCGAILYLISFFVKAKKDQIIVSAIFMNLLAVCFVFLSKELFSYYAGELVEHYNDASTGWASAASVSSLALSVVFGIANTSYSESLSAKTISEDGVLIAAAFVLNFIKLPITVSGSVNFQMLPLMIIALRRGPVHGFVCGGLIYGLLTCLTDGYGLATFPFDYLIGFGSVAVMGFFRNLILAEGQTKYTVKGEIFLLIAGIIATFIRFVGGSVSSIVLYGYTLAAAVGYNLAYVTISGALAVGVLMALYGPLCTINKLYPTSQKENKSSEEEITE